MPSAPSLPLKELRLCRPKGHGELQLSGSRRTTTTSYQLSPRPSFHCWEIGHATSNISVPFSKLSLFAMTERRYRLHYSVDSRETREREASRCVRTRAPSFMRPPELDLLSHYDALGLSSLPYSSEDTGFVTVLADASHTNARRQDGSAPPRPRP